EALEAAGVEQAAVAEAAGCGRRRIATEHEPAGAQEVTRAKSDQLLDAQRAPRGGDLRGLDVRIAHRRCEKRCVDRADAGAGDDIDRHVAAEPARQIGAQVLDDPGFVRTTRAAAGQDEADLRTGRRGLHSLYCRVAVRGRATV